MTAFVERHSVDVLVVGTSSRGGLGKVLLGSVAEEIIREAPCPVLTIGPHVKTDASFELQSIVCAVDFSAESLRAAEFAISLEQRYRANVTLVHVIQGAREDSTDPARQLIERRLREMIPAEADLPHSPELVVGAGHPGEFILQVAFDLHADIIVMGVRGAGAFAQSASRFGSIAHKVVSLAICPVLTVGIEKTLAFNELPRSLTCTPAKQAETPAETASRCSRHCRS